MNIFYQINSIENENVSTLIPKNNAENALHHIFWLYTCTLFYRCKQSSPFMRKQFVQMLALVIILISVASCSSSRNTSSSRYPTGTRTSKSQRTSDSFPGIIFPGSRTSTEGMPPGQAKKVNGDQSARAYAPGQQKKNKGVGKGNGNGNKGGKKKKGKKH